MNGRMARLGVTVALACMYLAVAGGAAAQSGTGGSIAGTVKDATGGVLPGVTVEAASPALIEKVRSVVTDTNGEYKIVDLRPGTYSVTFTLPGFSVVKREGIGLNAGFTAPVSAEMKVGSVEETITVTGATPIVDVQNVRNQTVLTHETLDMLPTGSKAMQNYATLILGANLAPTGQDVGGNKGEQTQGGFTVHGSNTNDSRDSQEGMIAFNGLEGAGGPGIRHAYPNPAFIQETVVTVGSASPEIENGGPQINLVPKDGGNKHSYYFNADFTSGDLQGNNLTDDLKARGLTTQAKVKKVYDVYPAAGGPIRQDRLWFYTAARRSLATEYVPGTYFNATHGTRVYTADLNRPAFNKVVNQGGDLRLTWQITPKMKLSNNNSVQRNCNCYLGISATTAPDAIGSIQYGSPKVLVINQVTWTYARSNKLLFESGFLSSYDPLFTIPPAGTDVDINKDIPYFEIARGLAYNARQATTSLLDYTGPLGSSQNLWGQRFAASYVTGSHAFKAGVSITEGHRVAHTLHPIGVRYEFLNGVPNRITQSASPFFNQQWLAPNLGLFAQDQWTLHRFTINAGVRLDLLRDNVPATHVDAGPFVPARDYPGVQNVPNWKDVNPRVGLAYDVFGNGKTAIKTSLGRFIAMEATGFAALNSPSNQIVPFITRTWNDANGNFAPDCDLTSALANGECGPSPNAKFGLPVPAAAVDDALRTGNRNYSWQAAVQMQHELRPGLALQAGYFRTWYGNYWAQVNRAVAPTDYDPYCITAPTDARLGEVSGQKICGLFDIKPAKFGQVDSFVTSVDQYGTPKQEYNGLDLGMNMRFGKGGLLQGGMNVGRKILDVCLQNDKPNVSVVAQNGATGGSVTILQSALTPKTSAYCHVSPPLTADMQFKFSGAYPLPWDMQLSGTFVNLPGASKSATATVPNAQIVPSLGRNLAACGAAATCTATVSVPVVIPNTTLFEERIMQVDLRLTKTLRFGRTRLQGMFDLYNALNADRVLGSVNIVGPTLYLPTAVLGARLVKFGVQLDF